MAPRSLGLWMLCLWIQGGVSAGGENMVCGSDTGILGKAVELRCCYPGEDLNSNTLRVQWQLEGNSHCVVAACLPGQSASSQCEHYKNRTELKMGCLHLSLLNISLEDSKTYACILQKRVEGEYRMIFKGLIRLEVAANDSENCTSLGSGAPNPFTHDNQQQTQVIAISSSAAAFVITTVIIVILYKRKHSLHRAYTAPVGMDVS